jgi:hypothetical protein
VVVSERAGTGCAREAGVRINEQLCAQGYAVMPDILADDRIDDLIPNLSELGGRAGDRRLLESPWCWEVGELIRNDTRISPCLPVNARAVQCTLFAKSLGTNWLVPLHQDVSIPMASRVDSLMYSRWSCKEGELFAHAPAALLQQLLAVRVHLDDCGQRNGALRVVPGSHRDGRLSPAEARRQRSVRGEHVVVVPRGGAMLMRPLLLHASSKAAIDLPRRVLNFLFGPAELPGGAQWPAKRPGGGETR